MLVETVQVYSSSPPGHVAPLTASSTIELVAFAVPTKKINFKGLVLTKLSHNLGVLRAKPVRS